MFGKLKKDEVAVLYQISNLSDRGEYHFNLDSEFYSLFPNEKEVLLCSLCSFDIIDILEKCDEKTGLNFYLVNLKFR